MTLIDGSHDVTETGPWDSFVAVPDVGAPATHVAEFAATFDAYGVHGDLDRISLVANDVAGFHLAGSLHDCHLDDLRTALFMTQQCWSSDRRRFDGLGSSYAVELVDAIRHLSGGIVRDDRPIRY